MKGDDDRLAKLHATLLQQVEGLVTGEDWTAFLAQSRRLHHYSAANQALLAAQIAERGLDADGDGLVASYRTWQRMEAEGGGTCQVRRGEEALWVWAPLHLTRRELDEDSGEDRVVSAGVRGFKAVAVFHQSQLTSPPAIAAPPLPQLLRGEEAPERVREAIEAELVAAGLTVEMVGRSAGQAWNGRTDFTLRLVEVHDDLEAPQRLKTLAHEWAHVALDHSGSAAGAARAVAEVEAESVAFLVCASVGLDASGYTIPYVSGWAGGQVEVVRATAERVLATTATLVGRLEERLDVTLAPDPLAAGRAEPAATLHADRTVSAPEPLPVLAERAVVPFAPQRTAAALTAEDRDELARQPAPHRVAYLLACAGYDAIEAAAHLRDLGIAAPVTEASLRAIAPFNGLDEPAEPLYAHRQVERALAVVYGPVHSPPSASVPATIPSPAPALAPTVDGDVVVTPSPASTRRPKSGLDLIERWAQQEGHTHPDNYELEHR